MIHQEDCQHQKQKIRHILQFHILNQYCKEENLKHFTKGAVEKLIEYSTRVSDSKDKLTARFNKIVDIIYEADAISDGNQQYITEVEVQNAINQKRYRSNKY